MRINRTVLYFIIVISFFFFNFYFRPVQGNPLMTGKYKNSSAYVNNLYVSDEFFKKNSMNKDEYYIYEHLIDDVKKGRGHSIIKCKTKGCSATYMTAYEAIYLDHPELIAFQSSSWKESDNTLDVSYLLLGKLQAFLGTRRIEREISIVQKETKNMTDKEKILFVYNYVASHDYDHLFMYSSSNQSAYSFFTKGSSVCAGFAKASQLLFQNIGIKSYLVMNTDHMWNYVEYEGKYYVFDATMGTGFRKDSNNYYSGLGETTVGVTKGYFENIYPPIEDTKLRTVFGV